MEPISTYDGDVDDFPGEELLLQAWRRTQLRRLGVSHVVAQRYAEYVDWHEVAALIERDCPPDLAVVIAF